MNTDIVRPLTVTATKPAANAPTGAAQQRDTASAPVPQASTAKPADVTMDTHSIQETTAAVAAQLESYLQSIGRSLQFRVDSASGRTVVSVKDMATGDVIRQIPSEEALRLAHALGEPGGSALVDIQV